MSCILPRSDPQRNLNTYTIVYWPQSSDREHAYLYSTGLEGGASRRTLSVGTQEEADL